jgi:nucleoside-diphosphate-sugar epimerase
MNILLSGYSGFLGRNIYRNLSNYHTLFKIGRSKESDFLFDFKNLENIKFNNNFDLVIHCAGTSSNKNVNITTSDIYLNFNVYGTINFLKLLEINNKLPKYFIFISSVSVYGLEKGVMISESNPLLANDSYGLSKIYAEKIITEWCTKHNIICTILRLPLLVGIDPPGSIGDMINGIKKGLYFNIYNNFAKKSVLHVDDVCNALINVSNYGGIYNLTDGYNPSIYEISRLISRQLGKNKPLILPYFFVKIFAIFGDIIKLPINTNKLNKLVNTLTFDDSKAKKVFGWNPSPIINKFKIHDNTFI